MTAATTERRSSRRPLLIGAALVAVLIVIGLIAGDSDTSKSGPPLSPTSTSSDGTRGLVLLLSEFGADVRVGQRLPDDATHLALLLHDGLDDQARAQLEHWVSTGGTLVVADPDSPLAPLTSKFPGSGPVFRATCDLPGLDDVSQLTAHFRVAFSVRREQPSCFGNGTRAFVVSTTKGQGQVIAIGSADEFTNELLDKVDNSVLAARLLLPDDGSPVAVLDPNPPGSGTTTLGDLIADRVFQAILQLGVAFVIYALWRSRRVGKPVTERQPVAIAGSQFVRAVGGLQQRSGATDRAAATLRIETRRLLSERLHVPVSADGAMLAELVVARTGLDRTTVAYALSDAPVLDEASLVALGRQLDTIRKHVLEGRQEVVDGRSR
jgi:hypothetical protein